VIPDRAGSFPTPPPSAGTPPSAPHTLSFDSYKVTGVHLRYDIASAIGREARVCSADAIALSSDWMVLGIPAMSAEQLTWLDRPVELQLTGVGGSTWTVNPAGKKGRVSVHEGSAGSAAVTITGDAGTFPVRGTGRESWREHDVTVKGGDEELGTKFLDAVRII
jgi:hypothetical protein